MILEPVRKTVNCCEPSFKRTERTEPGFVDASVTGMSSNGGPSESYEPQGRFVVNGDCDSSSAIQLNGVSVDMPNYVPGMNFHSAVPSSEGVQGFRIRQTLSAEYGRSGGVVDTAKPTAWPRLMRFCQQRS